MKSIVMITSLLVGSTALSHEFSDAMTDHFKNQVLSWAQTPEVISAIKAQNQANQSLTEAEIIALDNQWRSGVDSGGNELIQSTLANPLSTYLQSIEEQGEGLYTEIFVMDMKGLNVGQSSITSDYWQGDESKFQKTYGLGAGAIFVDEIEEDESTQMFQSQISGTLVDESGTPIGAITIGINVDEL